MSLLARNLFILMDSAIIWIYFRNNNPPISLTDAASLFRDTLAITQIYWKRAWLFHQISFKDHLMWFLLPRRHLLLLLSLVVLVEVVVVMIVVVAIVQVAVVVVVKTWPELVNNKLEARNSKYKFGARATKCKFGPELVNTNWAPGLVNANRRPGSVNTNRGPAARVRAGGQLKAQGPGNLEIQTPLLFDFSRA